MSKLFIISDKEVSNAEQVNYRKDELFGKKGESLLQYIIGNNPKVLSLDEIGESVEFHTISVEGGVTVGSIDIVALGSDGVISVIEVKLSDNREIRRQIIGQGLEYCAAIEQQWSVEKIKEESRKLAAESPNIDEIENVVATWIDNDEGIDEDDFWGDVKSNLENGVIRIFFIADKLPSVLINVLEYLNEHTTNNITFIGIECNVYKFGNSNELLFIPEVKGLTAKTRIGKIKSGEGLVEWDREMYLDWLKKCEDKNQHDILTDLLHFADENAIEDAFSSKGRKKTPVYNFYLYGNGYTRTIFTVYNDCIKLYFNSLGKISNIETANNFKTNMNDKLGLNIPSSKKEYYFKLDILYNNSKLKVFKEIILNTKNDIVGNK